MSASIDERVVYMKFDNKNFESNAQESLRTIDKLKQSLKFTDVQDKLGQIDLSGIRNGFSSLGDIDDSKITSVLDKLEYRMSTLGQFTGRIVQNIADDIYDVVKKTLDGIGKIADFAENGIVQGGYRRASNIQTAKFQLGGLGIAWEDVKGDIDYAVTNTAYSLDEAALVAAQLSTTGIEIGKEYESASGETKEGVTELGMILKAISGVAAQSGGMAGYADIGRQIVQMKSMGKVLGRDLDELGNATGINVRQVIADYFNKVGYEGKNTWTYDDILEATRSGFTDVDIVIEALYERFGEHASKANETLTGVIANTKSALARIGESFFEPLIENNGPLVTAFEILRQSINDLNKVIKPVVTSLGEYAASIVKGAVNFFGEEVDVIDPITGEATGEKKWQLKNKGGLFADFLEPFQDGKWVEKTIPGMSDHTYMQYEEETMTRAAKILDNLKDTITNIVDIFKMIGEAGSDAFKAVFPNAESLASKLVTISQKIKDITEAWKNSRFLDGGNNWQNSDLYHILRGLLSGVDIIKRFGSSFKEHIIDPIFNKGKEKAKSSGLWDYFVGMFDSIYEFDQKLQNMGDEDYFGPFFEKVKTIAKNVKDIILDAFDWVKEKFSPVSGKLSEFFDELKPKLKDGLESVKDWWKPVKDIFMNPDLEWGDKWQQIKDYFSANFELPGWTKVKELFSDLGDVVGGAWDKIKSALGLFGGGKKTESLTLSTMESGYNPNGNIGESATSMSLTIGDAVDTLDTDTSKMATIGERIKSFFSTISETFKNFDLTGVNGVITGFTLVFIVAFAAIAYVVYKVFKTLAIVVFSLPQLVESIVSNFNKLIVGITDTMKANRVETYSESLKNVAESVAILAGVFIAVAAFIMLVDYLDTDGSYVNKLIAVAIAVGSITIILGVIVVALGSLAAAGERIIKISKAGIFVQNSTLAYASIAACISAMVTGLVVISALIAAMSLLPWNNFKKGLAMVGIVAGILGGLLALVFVITWFMGRTKNIKGIDKKGNKIKDSNFANFAGIASMISALVTGMIVISGMIALMSLLPWANFWDGLKKVALVGVVLVALIGTTLAVVKMVEKISSKNDISAPKLAVAILGIALLMGSLVTATIVLAGIVALLAKVADSTGDSFKQAMNALALIGAFIMVVPTVLLYLNSDSVKNYDGKSLVKLAAMIAITAGAAVIISLAVKRIADLDFDSSIAAMVGLGSILVACSAMMVILTDTANNKDPKNAIGIVVGMGLMMAALYPVALAIEKVSNLSLIQYLAGLGGILLVLAAIGAMIQLVKKQAVFVYWKSVVGLTGGMALMALSLIPVALAFGILIKALDGANIDTSQMFVSLGLLIVGSIAIIGIASLLAKNAGDVKPKTMVGIAGSMMAIMMALLPLAASMALVFLALNSTPNIGPEMVVGVFGGLALVIVAIAGAGYALTQAASGGLAAVSAGSLKNVRTTMLAILGVFAATAVILGSFIAIMHVTGVNLGEALGLTAMLTIMMAIIIRLSAIMANMGANIKWGSDTSPKKFKAVFSTILVVVAAALACGAAIIAMNRYGSGGSWYTNLVNVGALLLSLSVVFVAVSAMIQITQKYKFDKSQLTSLATLCYGMLEVAGAVLVLAAALVMVNRFSEGNIWASVGVIGALAAGLTAMVWLLTLISSKINFEPEKLAQVIDSMVYATFSIVVLAGTALLINQFSKADMESATLVIVALAATLTAMIFALTIISSKVNFDPAKLKTIIIALAGSVAGILVLGHVMMMVADISWEDIGLKLLMFVGAIAILAVGLAVISKIIGTSSDLTGFGIMLLGFGVLMAGAGVLLYLAAEALSTFTDAILKVSDRGEDLKAGMSNMIAAVVAGLVAGFAEFNNQWPRMQAEISKFFNVLFPWLEVTLKRLMDHLHTQIGTIVGGLADIVADPQIQDDLARIVDSLLDWLDNNIDRWAEKITSIAGKLVKGIAKGVINHVDLNPTGSEIGTIAEGNSAIADWQYDQMLTKNLDMYYDQIEESIHDFYLKLGYLERDWTRFSKTDKMQGLIWMIIKATVLSDQDLTNFINESGGLQPTIAAALSSMAEDLGTGLEDNIRRYNLSTDNMTQLFSVVPENVRNDVEQIMGNWQDEFSKGLDWSGSVEELQGMLQELYDTTADDGRKAALYLAAKDLGIQLRTGPEAEYPGFIMGGIAAMASYKLAMCDEKHKKDIAKAAEDNAKAWINKTLATYGLDASLMANNSSWPYLVGELVEKEKMRGELQARADNGDWMAASKLKLYEAEIDLIKQDMIDKMEEVAEETGEATADASIDSAERKLRERHINGRPKMYLHLEDHTDQEENRAVIEEAANRIKAEQQRQFNENLMKANNEKYGEYVVQGFSAGMKGNKALQALTDATDWLKRNYVSSLMKSFMEHSPTEDPDIRGSGANAVLGWIDEAMKTAGIEIPGLTDTMAEDFSGSLEESVDKMDLAGFGMDIKNKISDKLPSFSEMADELGVDKGIQGNLTGIQNIFSKIKGAFNNEADGFSVKGALGDLKNRVFDAFGLNGGDGFLGGIGDKIKGFFGLDSLDLNSLGEGLGFDTSSIMESLGLDPSQFDASSLGFNIDITSGMDMTNFENEFSGFDINDFVDNNTLNVDMELDDQSLQDLMNQTETIAMANQIPTTAYQQSTVGSTYVNNYSYNQTLNSPKEISQREANRQNELLLSRRWGGYR